MLTKCPKCGCDISEYAYKCPKCEIQNDNRKDFFNINICKHNYEEEYFSYIYLREKDENAKYQEKNKKVKKYSIIVLSILFLIAVIMQIISSTSSYVPNLNETKDVICGYAELFYDGWNIPGTPSDGSSSEIFGITGKVEVEFLTDEEYLESIEWCSNNEISAEEYAMVKRGMKKLFGNPNKYEKWEYEKVLISCTYLNNRIVIKWKEVQ